MEERSSTKGSFRSGSAEIFANLHVSEKENDTSSHQSHLTAKQRAKINGFWGRADDDNTATSADFLYIAHKISGMTKEEALEIIVTTIQNHRDDPNFPGDTMAKLKLLVKGQAGDQDEGDYAFDLKAEAAIIYYHSPYPEVRSVTDPFDNPAMPAETFRAYVLGMMFMSGITALNTFFSPRQPHIAVSSPVMQLLLAPCGKIWAHCMPDWGLTFRGSRYSLNPGPWTFKEQMFATINFNVAHGVGSVYYVYLVQMLPQYLNQTWVSLGYEIMLALCTQFFGFGAAGLLRRFVIYPVTAIWPSVLPALALSRALVLPEKRTEHVSSWTLTRYKFFLIAFVGMFCYFWIPNFLFTALRSFNWMTWIIPNNFSLGMITGFWGGMGYNPLATFDWNVSGSAALIIPFFSHIQQYSGRLISGLIIIGMYWSNFYWSAYMPINSNEAFANDGSVYNATKLLNQDVKLDLDKYKKYGPPYFSGANLFGQGAWFAWYPMTLSYVCIHHYEALKKSFIEMYKSLRYRTSIYEGNADSHTRMMRKYKEVPDWWFCAVLFISLILSIIAFKVYPVQTPAWTLFAIMGISAVFLIPTTLLTAYSHVSMGFGLLFQLLAGLWFPGNPQALIIITSFGGEFNAQADTYISDQKLGHYAKISPRAIFRGQMLAVFFNSFIFVGVLNWMVVNFDNGTLCTWKIKEHFVCTRAVLVFASGIEYGAFGVRNFFKLYPFLPWCFLVGGFVGISVACVQKFGPELRDGAHRKWSEGEYAFWNKWVFEPITLLHWFNPAIFWSGALNWTGGNNLSYATNGMYLSFIFMYYTKRHYLAWWEKYNYLLSAGFNVGVAISGIVQTLLLDVTFRVDLDWWGNSVSTAGVDFLAYNQNASLYHVPPEGYFGLVPQDFPMNF